jgi:hypothetical protein
LDKITEEKRAEEAKQKAELEAAGLAGLAFGLSGIFGSVPSAV